MGSGSSKAAAEKAAAEKAAAEKGSDRHLWQAARDGDEAELRRLIGLGWSVNWHNPDVVRRRMCLAWAPASSSPLLLSPPRSPETAPVPTARCTARGRAGCAATPPPRRAWHTRPRRMARAAPPRARPRSSRALWHSMTPRVLHLPQLGDTALIAASWTRHEGCVRLLLAAKAIEVNAKVSLEHALPQHMRWIRSHVVIPLGLSFVFRTSTI